VHILRISTKGRYALAALTLMAQRADEEEKFTVHRISEALGISKIYLEQVFSFLKRDGLVNSIKGAQGGYQLSRPASDISVYDVLSVAELLMFEKTESSVDESAPGIEKAMTDLVFNKIDKVLLEALKSISLSDLAKYASENNPNGEYMFFI
jgi:Rrf2 family protein